jgi:NAD(P)-dependent dehydrogenase (short-subunit alcohol dehydrogenase family)
VIAASAAASGASLEEAERQINARMAIGRIVDAQEVAYVVAFLASPKSVAITGDAIAAGGGAKGVVYY